MSWPSLHVNCSAYRPTGCTSCNMIKMGTSSGCKRRAPDHSSTAGCAGTLLAEIPHGIDRLVPIVPFDTQHTLLNPGHVFRFRQGLCHDHGFLLTT